MCKRAYCYLCTMESYHEAPVPVVTGDGSHTLFHPVLKEHYHSLEGSLQESGHIYLGLGLLPWLAASPAGRPVRVFEMGFGTGLNALLSWKAAEESGKPVLYTGIEAYPVGPQQSELLNYGEFLQKIDLSVLHTCPWGERLTLSPCFSFKKVKGFLQDYTDEGGYDVVYFDAFSPDTQPELWTPLIFSKIAQMMTENGYLVTYSSKGSVRRALAEAGFTVEKHPGPGRKREVIRAIRK